MKQRWMKCLEKDKFNKNSRMHFEEYYTSIVHVSLILYVSFSLKLRFEFNVVLNGFFFIIFTTFYLLFYLLINISYFTNLEIYLVPLYIFVRPSKSLKVLKVCSLKMFLLCLYFPREVITCWWLKLVLMFLIVCSFYMPCKSWAILCMM